MKSSLYKKTVDINFETKQEDFSKNNAEYPKFLIKF